MKSTLGYIAIVMVLVSSLLPGLGFAELNKIPTLIEHYKHHKEESGDKHLSITDFLAMHYNASSSHKQEEEHGDLPLFHSCCHCFVFIVEETLVCCTADFTFSKTQGMFTVNNYAHLPFKGIFQPPKFS